MEKVTCETQKKPCKSPNPHRKVPLFDHEKECTPNQVIDHLSGKKAVFTSETNQNEPEKLRDNTCRIIAYIHGVSPSYVRKIRNGERRNESIMETMIDYEQEHSFLIEKLQELVPLRSEKK